jgi:hypothetical protein
VTPRLLWPSWRWMTVSGDALVGHLDGMCVTQLGGAKRRRTPAAVAVRRRSARTAAADHVRSRVGPLMTQELWTDRQLKPQVQPWA